MRPQYKGYGRGDPWGSGLEHKGGRRMFDGSELKLLLLHLIAEEPRHGYDLIRAVGQLSQGGYAPSPGMVYPILTMLAEMEWVNQMDEGQRKRFAIASKGRESLSENA